MASKRHKRRECLAKIHYPTAGAARAAVTRCYTLYGRELVPYPCRLCGSWHVGHERGAYGRLTAPKRALA